MDALASPRYARVRAGGTIAERISDSHPQVVVINLGPNDYACLLKNAFMPDTPCRYPDFTLDDFLDDAHAMVASVAGACIIGTTTWFGDVVGPLWSDMVATGEIAGVVRWQEYLSTLSADERQLLLADSLGHLTLAGEAALAEMTAQVVDQSCASSPDLAP